ncbi:zinc finger protein 260-like isoform X2 [Linepithema humile]|uniref:zinc finger protein 260-like isoform X2 n=1 Tax=Linepithema humile TaxID=83485 RepID=UPI0006235873|nr:PREDICTED: zinc finger protein 236-like isoform X2 [Linepithema humile]
MITCAANGCPSTQTTKIDGNLMSFFAFPEDDLKNQWLHNCNSASGVVNDKQPLHLCELHFEKENFTPSKDLKSSAVPTLFGKIEGPPIKRKMETALQTTPEKISLKQKKLDEDTLVTPPQSPFTQDNVEDAISGSKTIDCAINGSVASSLEPHENLQTKEKTYCLIIQIDKVRCKPGPIDNDVKDLSERKSQTLQTLAKKICAKGSCKLKRCIYNSKPALQCKICDQYYIIKGEEEKSYPCSICSKTFPNPQSLYVHIRKHFICDMCQTECSSQIMYDKHAKLHVSTDPLHPYKCHQCLKTFELKEGVKQHCLTEHSKTKLQNTLFHFASPSVTTTVSQQNDYRCTSCNINLKNDQAYRNHINLHKKNESLSNININEANNIIVPNPLTGSQIGILQPVKFSCRVCSKEFDNVREVDLHTRTHLEDVEEDLKCNICKKFFKSSTAFSEHLKHHLSRAYPCPVCSKAFINRTTLKIHLKTHSD